MKALELLRRVRSGPTGIADVPDQVKDDLEEAMAEISLLETKLCGRMTGHIWEEQPRDEHNEVWHLCRRCGAQRYLGDSRE